MATMQLNDFDDHEPREPGKGCLIAILFTAICWALIIFITK